MTQISRRGVLGAGALLGAAALGTATAPDASAAAGGTSPTASADAAGADAAGAGGVREERKSLQQLYADAKREGGKLVIYAGGDNSSQLDTTKQAFLSQFPGIDLTAVIDYSKYHDVRIDNQLATGTLVPDVVHLQTQQDFTRWKSQGVLQHYKPAGFSAIYPKFKDPDGAWFAFAVYSFSYVYRVSLGSSAPATPRDLVDVRWKGAIASSYPNDDDAVLYLYRLYAQAYGWDWVRRLAAQNPQFGRGTPSPATAVVSGQKLIGIGAAGALTDPVTSGVQWALPKKDPFMAWGQRAAILKAAAHPAAAKLYLNWQLSLPVQQASANGWSVRTDVTPPDGLRPIWTYPNAHLDGFPAFMADRAEAERWRQTFTLYFGEVQGPPTPGVLGLHPGS